MRVHAERGASLVVTLLMLVAVLLLGVSAARIALQAERASRNDRDRQIALQAAEAALMDAEVDIEESPDPSNSRSALFGPDRATGFSAGCQAGGVPAYQGLCLAPEDGAPAAWQTVDFLDQSTGAASVPYGRFTGQQFQHGKGSLPGRLPRYIIERLFYHLPGEDAAAGHQTSFYRITAVGFGMRDSTQVMLQTFYRKEKN